VKFARIHLVSSLRITGAVPPVPICGHDAVTISAQGRIELEVCRAAGFSEELSDVKIEAVSTNETTALCCNS
jgi:hypothetical protein